MIELYMMNTCGYCCKVINFLEDNQIPYEKIDITISANREKLINIGGKAQVPFIVDKENNIQMYESNDIIEYLKELKKREV
jgi:glutaredoxin